MNRQQICRVARELRNAGNRTGSQVVENMERETGLEPATSSLGSWHSTTELLPRSSTTSTYHIRNNKNGTSSTSAFGL